MKSAIGDNTGIKRISYEGKYTIRHKLLPNIHSYLAMIDTKPKATFDQLMRAFIICGYNINETISSIRKKEILSVRYALIHHLLYTVSPKMSLKEIGVAVGGRDHTSIIHARDTMKDLADVGQDGPIAVHVQNITKALAYVKQADEARVDATNIASNTTKSDNYDVRYSYNK